MWGTALSGRQLQLGESFMWGTALSGGQVHLGFIISGDIPIIMSLTDGPVMNPRGRHTSATRRSCELEGGVIS